MAKNENVVLIPLRLKNHGLEIPDVPVALRRFSSITVEPGLQTEHLYPEGTWSDRQAKVRDWRQLAFPVVLRVVAEQRLPPFCQNHACAGDTAGLS